MPKKEKRKDLTTASNSQLSSPYELVLSGQQKRLLEEIVHCVPVKQDSTQNTNVPDVVGPTEPIEKPRIPPFGHLHGVDESTSQIHRNLEKREDDVRTVLRFFSLEVHGELTDFTIGR